MQISQLKDRIERIEQCADEAEAACRTGNVPAQLRQSIDTLHQHAQQAQQACESSQQQGDPGRLQQMVMQLEEDGDRAMQACRTAGSVDPKVQQAVQRAHQEASSLKKQLQMG